MTSELHPYLGYSGIMACAHRGGAKEHPENSMRAFSSAVAMGFRYLETDARLTSDDRLLAFHDERLSGVTDGEGLVSAMPWSAVRQARIAGTEPVVELAELFETFPGAYFHIDIKHWAALRPCLDLIQHMGRRERVSIGSPSDLLLGRVRKWLIDGGHGVCTTTGPLGVAALKARTIGIPLRSMADCAQAPVKYRNIPVINKKFIETCHALGMPVHAWTIDDPVEMRELIALGVDGLLTDKPSVLKRVLVDMQLW